MKTYSELYSLLLGRIKTLLDFGIFSRREENRKMFSEVILDFFPLLSWLREVTGATDDINELFERFKKVYGLDGEVTIRKIEYAGRDLEDFEDEINFLKVCVNNSLGLDLDNINPQTSEKLDLPDVGVEEGIKRNSEVVYQSLIGNMEENLSSAEINGIFIQAKARAKLQAKVMTGEVYIFKTKPKINLFVKGILGTIWLAGFVFVLVGIIGNALGENSNTEGKIYGYLVFFCLFFIFNLFLILDTLRNDNFKYSFSNKPFLTTFPSLFLFLVVSTFWLKLDGIADVLNRVAVWGSLASAGVGCILYMASFLYLQPEKDKDLLDGYMKEYISDESTGTFSHDL